MRPSSSPSEQPRPTTRLHATRLHATLDGPAGAPVLVLGGSLGSTGAMWTPQLAGLAASFRVVRYDHLGHGGSLVPPGPYTIDGLGRELVALLDDLGVDRASLAGVSLGGMVGMWVAAHAPHRVHRLVLFCTSALLGPAEMWRQRAAAVRAGGMTAVADAVMARWFTAGFVRAHPAMVAAHRAMLVGTPAEGYAGCCEAIAEMDLRADLASISAPTLVVAGADDPATPPSHAELIAAGIADARLVVLPDAAHLATAERPDQTARLLLDHVSRPD
jgi:3-oxoadipate enol-lactonase